jgi:hypothetical protein
MSAAQFWLASFAMAAALWAAIGILADYLNTMRNSH